jgi:GNAT superfamily N-acetyltransferase
VRLDQPLADAQPQLDDVHFPLDERLEQPLAPGARRQTRSWYYTLAAGGIPPADLPASLVKKVPRYPSVLVARLGRLAVDRAYRGRELGSAPLRDAIERSLRSGIAVFELVVDAKDDQAEAFYRHHGFVSFGSLPRQLVLPLTNLRARASFLIPRRAAI